MWWQVFTSVAILLLNIAICIRLYGELIDYRRSNIIVFVLGLLVLLFAVNSGGENKPFIEGAFDLVVQSLFIILIYIFPKYSILSKRSFYNNRRNKELLSKYPMMEWITNLQNNFLEWCTKLWLTRLHFVLVIKITNDQLKLVWGEESLLF